MSDIKILLATFRRPELLKRAINSIQKQKNTNWTCLVHNDDPFDQKPFEIITQIKDPRFQIFNPIRKRGAARVFNEAFKLSGAKYSALLEDDNWWEPNYLNSMIDELEKNPSFNLAVSNEKIWMENKDKTWTHLKKTIWNEYLTHPYETNIVDACGTAKICNSSMLWRQRLCQDFLTPDDIPIDVTEHFRERVIPQPFLLVGKPLVNFSITQLSSRSKNTSIWGDYQALLIGSCFASIKKKYRLSLAKKLFLNEQGKCSPKVTSLLSTGVAIREARILFSFCNSSQLVRFFVSIARRPSTIPRLLVLRDRLKSHWKFLLNSPFNKKLFLIEKEIV